MAGHDPDKILSQSILFSGLPPSDRSALAKIAKRRHLAKNHTLFSQGEPAEGFYLVLSGRIKVYKLSQEGKEHILHIFGPGEPVGEVPVFSGKDYPAFAETLTRSELLYFPRAAFLQLASRHPQILLNMLATLSSRLRTFAQRIEQLSLKEVASRLGEVLLEMAESSPGDAPGIVDLYITKAQLASQIGTTPETLSRTFQKMARGRLIRVTGKRVELLDRQRLEELALGTYPLEA